MSTITLNKITAPELTSTQYGKDIKDQFANINENFRLLGNHDFVKGDTGRSIRTKVCPLMYTSAGNGIFTQLGIDVLNALFNGVPGWPYPSPGDTPIADVREYIDWTQTQYGPNELANVHNISVLDFFSNADEAPAFIELYEYDPVIGEDDPDAKLIAVINNIVFKDYRFVQASDNLSEEDITQYSNLVDKSASVYGIVEESGVKYDTLHNFPTLYYDPELKAFCWNFAGAPTGIIAQGPRGLEGLSGNMVLCTSLNSAGEIVQFTKDAAYKITNYHSNTAEPSSSFFNVKATTGSITQGTNCIFFLAAPSKDTSVETYAFISTVYGDGDELFAYCGHENCIQDNFTVNKFLNSMNLIDYSGVKSNTKGITIPFVAGQTAIGDAHMIWSRATDIHRFPDEGREKTIFDELHISPLDYAQVSKANCGSDRKYGDEAWPKPQGTMRFIDDYDETLVENKLFVGGYFVPKYEVGGSTEGTMTPAKLSVNGCTNIAGELRIIRGENTTGEIQPKLIVGGSTTNTDIYAGSRAGYIEVLSGINATGNVSRGSIAVDKICTSSSNLCDDVLFVSNVTIGSSSNTKSLTVYGPTTTNNITNTGSINNTGNITNVGQIRNTGNITNAGQIRNTGDITVSSGVVTIRGVDPLRVTSTQKDALGVYTHGRYMTTDDYFDGGNKTDTLVATTMSSITKSVSPTAWDNRGNFWASIKDTKKSHEILLFSISENSSAVWEITGDAIGLDMQHSSFPAVYVPVQVGTSKRYASQSGTAHISPEIQWYVSATNDNTNWDFIETPETLHTSPLKLKTTDTEWPNGDIKEADLYTGTAGCQCNDAVQDNNLANYSISRFLIPVFTPADILSFISDSADYKKIRIGFVITLDVIFDESTGSNRSVRVESKSSNNLGQFYIYNNKKFTPTYPTSISADIDQWTTSTTSNRYSSDVFVDGVICKHGNKTAVIQPEGIWFGVHNTDGSIDWREVSMTPTSAGGPAIHPNSTQSTGSTVPFDRNTLTTGGIAATLKPVTGITLS